MDWMRQKFFLYFKGKANFNKIVHRTTDAKQYY